ncbi:MAG: 7-carboxy-7-deazaguanine synthase QueE [Desulfuromonadales bacterium]|nr:7-carboxy-7-deazaguanine synthase QueE [Desulfuromonadales bacterium]
MPVIPAINAPLIEVFSSMQGEGVLIGCRQVFVRFAECNLACDYCDTPYQSGPTCQIESRPGSGQFSSHSNPVNLAEISGLISGWQDSSNHVHHSVALTGGEPLLHADVLQRWLPELSAILPVFLETNGTLAAELEKILPLVEWISMDIKGSAVTGAATPWRDHGDFLTLAKKKLCQVKLVVDAATTDAELLEAASLVNRHAPHVPFVLQPRTLAGVPSLRGKVLLRMQTIAAEEHRDVRVIPQIHPWLGVA